MGILSGFFNSDIKLLKAKARSEGSCEYKFKIINKPIFHPSKKPYHYHKLNEIPKIEGIDLKDAIRMNVFKIKRNHVFFRNKRISNLENTIFHLFSNEKLFLHKVPKISYNYFNEIIKENRSSEEKLNLLKTLLQTMGWGIVKIVKTRKQIKMEIDNPPYGLQFEPDNWNFLVCTILGYLWLLNKNLNISETKYLYKKLVIKFSL
ncbi:MAG: hypothetical protein DRP16_03440 [Candidatus Aenigmatarchaeota archaeon]|nr:MAG: hypothetical protein DRP16_03440 [Candidatus Aenigmarchaeota archaeon]